MKTNEMNKINLTQAKEIAAKEAAAAKLTEEEILAAVKPEGFLDLLARVYNDEIKMITDENDNIIGMNITKATAVNVVKIINGQFIIGADEKEAKADELEQKKFAKAYAGKPVQHWYELALQLKAGNYKPDDVVETAYGLVFILADQKKMILENGSTLITVDVPKGTAKSVIIELLKAKLAAVEVKALKEDLEAEKRISASLRKTNREDMNKISNLMTENADLKKENISLKNSARERTVLETPITSVEIDLSPIGHCSIVLCERLRNMTLEEAILAAINANKNLIGITRENNPYVKGAKFVAGRIMSNIPIEAESRRELHEKLSKIIYNALKDSPTLGFTSHVAGYTDSDTAMRMADKMATSVMANAIIG